jgi:hypothetical protein
VRAMTSKRGLTDIQRAELKRLGVDYVRLKATDPNLGNSSRESPVGGFDLGPIRRGDLDDWLAEELADDRARQRTTTPRSFDGLKSLAWPLLSVRWPQ